MSHLPHDREVYSALTSGSGHKFNADSRSLKKCTLYNNDTKEVLTAQFNPTKIPYGRSATYSETVSPGMNYPLTQYNHGDAISFDVELFYYDFPYSGKIDLAREFLLKLLPPENNRNNSIGGIAYRPPTFRLVYGYWFKTLVLTNLEIEDDWLNSWGNPLMTTFKLSVRQV